jgi:putative DNA primase/helicase
VSISQSINQTQLREYALALYQQGFNVVPMRSDDKIPDLPTWRDYIRRRQTEQEIINFAWSQNIGVICGMNGIRVIDLDGCSDADILFKVLELLGLEPDYQWIVYTPGRGGGFHIYIHCLEPLTLTDAGKIVGKPLVADAFYQLELRWSGCCVMFPPSIHPEAKEAYNWAFCSAPASPIASVSLAVVEKMFLTVAAPQKKTAPEPPKPLAPLKPAKYDSWAEKALTQEIANLRAAGPGGRNDQLNRSAFCLGQIVGAGLLDEQDVTDELTRAALTVGLDAKEIGPTITSGLEAGAKKPRMPKQIFKENEPPVKLPPVKSIDDEKLAAFSADDQGHAEAVYSLYGPYIAYNEAYGWMIWNGTHFAPSVQRINTLIIEVLRRRQKAAAHLERTDLAKVSRAQAGTVSATRSLLENLAFVDVSEFDAEPDLINTLSGIVNLKTKKLLPHDPVYRFTWCSPVRYNPDASGNLWLDFLNATVATPDMVGYLQEALGYSITGHISEECLFYIFGPPRAGKGTLTETILAIFPRPIAVETDFNTFTQKREGDSQNFDLAPLKAARLVFASESNKYQSLNPAKVKALTGGNLVYCSFKHKDMFNYRPQYAVWLSSNHEVNADADDDALWGRVKVISFPYSNLGKEDKTLKACLQSSENLEYVLAWLVEGAYLWYQHAGRGLQTPESIKDLTQSQRAAQDSVGVWLEECCELKPDEWTENSRVMASYKAWCEENGYEPKKAKGLAQSLAANRGLEVGVVRRITDDNLRSKMARGVKGLTIL